MVERDRKRRKKLEEIVDRYDVTAVLFGSRAGGMPPQQAITTCS